MLENTEENVLIILPVYECFCWGWRDGSAVKNTGCFFKGLGFDFQHLHGGSQLSVSPVPRDPLWPLWTLHTVGAQIDMQANHTYMLEGKEEGEKKLISHSSLNHSKMSQRNQLTLDKRT